jgi:hypothetical protein
VSDDKPCGHGGGKFTVDYAPLWGFQPDGCCAAIVVWDIRPEHALHGHEYIGIGEVIDDIASPIDLGRRSIQVYGDIASFYLDCRLNQDILLAANMSKEKIEKSLGEIGDTRKEARDFFMEYGKLVEEIEGYQAILSDPARVMDIIREDTFEIKEKYGDDRRTEISGDVTDMNMDDLIAPEDMVVTMSHGGYMKSQPVDEYRAQRRGGIIRIKLIGPSIIIVA